MAPVRQTDPKSEKLKGTIKRIKRTEGFGFLTHTATGTDYFFHRSVVEPQNYWDDLEEDQPVEFIPVEGPKGPRASSVFLL